MSDDQSPDDDREAELRRVVLAELKTMRKTPNDGVYRNDFIAAPTLVRYIGAGNAADAHVALLEIVEAARFHDRGVQAAYTSLYWSLADGIDARMREAARELGIDPRNARKYSDRGLETVAYWVVRRIVEADPGASPRCSIEASMAAKGNRLALRIAVIGSQGLPPRRPRWITVDRERIQFGDGKVVDDSGSRQTVAWTVGATLPPTGSEEAEREVAIAFGSRALATMDFVDRFDHPELRVVFTASRNTAYVRVISK